MKQPLRNHLDYLREECLCYLRTGGDTGDEEYLRLDNALTVAASWHYRIHGTVAFIGVPVADQNR